MELNKKPSSVLMEASLIESDPKNEYLDIQLQSRRISLFKFVKIIPFIPQTSIDLKFLGALVFSHVEGKGEKNVAKV